MDKRDLFNVVLGSASVFFLLALICAVYICRRRSAREGDLERRSLGFAQESDRADLFRFPGGEELTIQEILDAPGEVVGKSSYGTLYMARLLRSDSLMLLRFLRPACTERTKDILSEIQLLGFVRHPNLVPLLALYTGLRGEKLLVHPFFSICTLSQFLRGASGGSYGWPVVFKISLGVAKGLHYLHTSLQQPIIHGNLRSRNVLLDSTHQPHISDFGLHLLLNPAAAQVALDATSYQAYKAPELIKMKDASKESDIYSFGVILLEMLTRKEPLNWSSSSSLDLHNDILSRKIPTLFDLDPVLRGNSIQGSVDDDILEKYFRVAMSCCSSSPSLRPSMSEVVRKLEEIGWR